MMSDDGPTVECTIELTPREVKLVLTCAATAQRPMFGRLRSIADACLATILA